MPIPTRLPAPSLSCRQHCTPSTSEEDKSHSSQPGSPNYAAETSIFYFNPYSQLIPLFFIEKYAKCRK
jgi:hypothetical protein